jgi:hypothetical protein
MPLKRTPWMPSALRRVYELGGGLITSLLTARFVDHRAAVTDAQHPIQANSHGALTFQLAKMAT